MRTNKHASPKKERKGKEDTSRHKILPAQYRTAWAGAVAGCVVGETKGPERGFDRRKIETRNHAQPECKSASAHDTEDFSGR